MTQNPQKPEQIQTELNYSIIKKWLIKNPEYFDELCTLITEYFPPRFNSDNNIVDIQQLVLHRMRNEINRQKSRETQLLDAAKDNTLSQSRIHKAVLSVLGISSLEEFLSLISQDLPNLLNVKTVLLSLDGKVKVPKGEDRIILQSTVTWPQKFFQNDAEDINSCACLKLTYGIERKNAVLLLGASDPEAFHPGQGTELLAFFADVLEISLSRWMLKKP